MCPFEIIFLFNMWLKQKLQKERKKCAILLHTQIPDVLTVGHLKPS